MKRIVALIFIVAASMSFSIIPILAAENCPISSAEYDKLIQSNFKDQCLIVAKNCATESNTVQQRVYDRGNYSFTAPESIIFRRIMNCRKL
jgi:hypothetical protein